MKSNLSKNVKTIQKAVDKAYKGGDICAFIQCNSANELNQFDIALQRTNFKCDDVDSEGELKNIQDSNKYYNGRLQHSTGKFVVKYPVFVNVYLLCNEYSIINWNPNEDEDEGTYQLHLA